MRRVVVASLLWSLSGCAFRVPALDQSDLRRALVDGGDLFPAADLSGFDRATDLGCAQSCAPGCNQIYAGEADYLQSCSGAGCSCGLACAGPDHCSLSCASGTTCQATVDNAKNGLVDCVRGARCTLRCADTVDESCIVNCNGGTCLLFCGAQAGNCVINGCGSPVLDCPNRVRACGLPCP
jgi:hypothetical protein